MKENKKLDEMVEEEYESESLLQELLVYNTGLLAGEQMDSNNPRKWLLVSREMKLSFEEGGKKVLPVDHLFLDQDGIPTLVEVKRSSDHRIRREVVGQMLDYAANSVDHLPIEDIKNKINNEKLKKFLEDDPELSIDTDKFYEKVENNLQLGKIRMVFVADIIPNELKTIVEFMNVQMRPAEVLAVEVKQYIGKNQKTLVPKVIGQTAEAEKIKPTKSILNKEKFIESLDPIGKEFFEQLLEFAEENNLVINWGGVGFSMNVDLNGKNVSILQGYSPESIYGQIVTPTFGLIKRSIQNPEKIIQEYKNGLKGILETGKGFKWIINEDVKEVDLDKFYQLLVHIVNLIRKEGN